jgi:hypothetical protein
MEGPYRRRGGHVAFQLQTIKRSVELPAAAVWGLGANKGAVSAAHVKLIQPHIPNSGRALVAPLLEQVPHTRTKQASW